jgi:hypothetical protein
MSISIYKQERPTGRSDCPPPEAENYTARIESDVASKLVRFSPTAAKPTSCSNVIIVKRRKNRINQYVWTVIFIES